MDVNILPGYSISLKADNIEIDAGIKLILAVLLAIAVPFCADRLDLLYFASFLLIITFFLKSDFRFILKNLAAYGVIFIFPYFCGLLLSLLMSGPFSGSAYFDNCSFEATFMKMVKIFFIWYIGSLYFFTTPFEAIAKMLNKVFRPLNALGIPVSRYLQMIMFIVNELTSSVSQFKQDIWEQARHIIKNKHLGIKSKFQELSNILAAFIADSLQRTDEIQEQVELTRVNDHPYTLKVSKNEALAVLGCIAFLWFFFANGGWQIK